MISPKLLQSNVLRRIYKDSTFEAAQLRAQGTAANLADFPETSTRFFDEASEHASVVSAALAELTKRGEALR